MSLSEEEFIQLLPDINRHNKQQDKTSIITIIDDWQPSTYEYEGNKYEGNDEATNDGNDEVTNNQHEEYTPVDYTLIESKVECYKCQTSDTYMLSDSRYYCFDCLFDNLLDPDSFDDMCSECKQYIPTFIFQYLKPNINRYHRNQVKHLCIDCFNRYHYYKQYR